MEEALSKLHGVVVTYGLSFIAAVVILVVGKWVAGLISRLIERLMVRANIDKTIAVFVRRIAYIALLIFVIIAAIDKIGVRTTSLVAIFGAAGLAVGLALQGSLANFAAGVLIIFFKPFTIGDYVEAGGASGSVEEIRIFSTVLRSPDNRKIIIPNARITGDNITNYTAVETRRVDMVFGISYDDDIKKAKGILEGVVASDSRVLEDPKPVIAVSELADSSVNLVVRPWVKPTDYWGVYFDTLEKGKAELERNGITIPFPQMDVHMASSATSG